MPEGGARSAGKWRRKGLKRLISAPGDGMHPQASNPQDLAPGASRQKSAGRFRRAGGAGARVRASCGPTPLAGSCAGAELRPLGPLAPETIAFAGVGNFYSLLLQTLLRDERVGSSFEGCVRWTQRGLRLGLAELGFWTRRNATRRSGNWRWPKRTIRSTLRLTLSMRPCCLVRLLLRPRSRSRRRTMPRLRKTCCRRSGGVGLRALAVRTAVGTTFALGARLAASLGTAARVAGKHSTR